MAPSKEKIKPSKPDAITLDHQKRMKERGEANKKKAADKKKK